MQQAMDPAGGAGPRAVTPHTALLKHMPPSVSGSVYAVLAGAKVRPAGARDRLKPREPRFLVATAAWLFAVAPGGAVKRCWAWRDVEVRVRRSGGRVREVMVREENEKDLVIAVDEHAEEGSHRSAEEAIDVMRLVSQPGRGGRPLVPPEHDNEDAASLVTQATKCMVKPNTLRKMEQTSHSPPRPRAPPRPPPPAAPPPDLPPPENRTTSPLRQPGGGCMPPAGECPTCGRGGASVLLTDGPALCSGMRVRCDKGRLGTIEREFQRGDLALFLDEGGLFSPRMSRALFRVPHWWVILDPPPLPPDPSADAWPDDPDGGAVLRRADRLLPVSAHPHSSSATDTTDAGARGDAGRWDAAARAADAGR